MARDLYDSNNEYAGYVDDDGYAYAADGTPIGRVEDNGHVYDRSGRHSGHTNSGEKLDNSYNRGEWKP